MIGGVGDFTSFAAHACLRAYRQAETTMIGINLSAKVSHPHQASAFMQRAHSHRTWKLSFITHCIFRSERPAGIFHAAGVLDDRMIVNQNAASVSYVFGPKACPALLIHDLSVFTEMSLHMYASSVAAVVGG